MRIKYLDQNNQEQTINIEDYTKESYNEIIMNDIIEYIDVPKVFQFHGTIDARYTNGRNFINKVWEYFELPDDDKEIIDDTDEHGLIDQYEIKEILEAHQEYQSISDFAHTIAYEEVPKHLMKYIDWEQLGKDMIDGMDAYYTDNGLFRVFMF